MDSTTFFSVLLYAVVSLVSLTVIFRLRKNRKPLPPSPPSIPFFGHFFFLKKPLHRTFHSISQKYGPIFSLQLGSRRIVVVSSPSLFQECFSTNDVVFANRPEFLNSTHVAYNNTTIGTAPFGHHWKSLRKIAATELLSSQNLRVSQPVRSDEVRRMVAKLARESNARFVKVDMTKTITEVILNIVMRIIAGKRYYDDDVVDPQKIKDSKKFQEIFHDVFEKSGAGNPADYFPIMKLFSSKYVDRVKELGVRMDEFTQSLLDDSRRNTEKQDTFVYHLLCLQQQEPELYTDVTIKGLLQSVILAGTDTSVASLSWAMSNLLNHPHILEKARKEIDETVGSDRLLDESDIPNLPYLNNIISENFRLCPVGPLAVPHYSSDDCTIGGYHIPRGTILLANMWTVHRDPNVWPEPEVFRPERFDSQQEIDSYRFLPFGIGRRACPGNNLGLKFVGLTLGAFVQCFDWKTVDDVAVDMTEGLGMAMHRAEPLVVMCKSRPVARYAA